MSSLQDTLKLINEHLTDRFAFPAQELVGKHPPRLYCKNKKLVYELSCPKGAESFHGILQYTRWKEFVLPKKFPTEQKLEIVSSEGVFNYAPPETENAVPWYLNFADANVFGYYGGGLYAQDESQCLEHPALCSLREALSKVSSSSSTPALTTVHDKGVSVATPILIRGVERRAEVKTDPNEEQGRPLGLYGNVFASADPEAVKNATTIFDERVDSHGKPYYSNILAMEAPKYGFGKYTISAIYRILTTAYTGYLAARFESMVETGMLLRNHDPGSLPTVLADDADRKALPKVVIHTGNWGCGAYGGNITMMALLQIAAAHLAGIDKLIYHAMGSANQRQFEEGLALYKKMVNGEISVNAFVHEAEVENLQWGVSNGT